MGANYERAGSVLHLSGRWQRHALRLLLALVLTGALFALGLLTDALGLLPKPMAAPSASGAQLTILRHTDTTPMLTLLSPSSEQGPVGATLTVSGQNFTTAAVTIYAASDVGCTSAGQTLATAQATNGSFTTDFQWPVALNSGVYYLCATGVTAGAAYHVSASSPPVLSLSAASVQVGQQITIIGDNFTGLSGGQTVSLILSQSSQGGATLPLKNVTPQGNGAFSYTYTPDGYITGAVTLTAQSSVESGAQKPSLSASAQFTIAQAASPTPTPSPTATASATPTAVAGTSTSAGGSDGGSPLLIILAIVLTLIVLGALGTAAFFILRGRGGNGGKDDFPGGPGSPSSPGGYGRSSSPGYGPGSAGVPVGVRPSGAEFGAGMGPNGGRFSNPGQYGRSGVYDPPNPYGDQPIGGVSTWDESQRVPASQWDGANQWGAGDPVPGPDWQPRPMSGTRRRYEDPSYPPGAPTAGGQLPADPYPPADPWNAYPGGYTGATQDFRGGFGNPPSSAPNAYDPYGAQPQRGMGQTGPAGGPPPTPEGWNPNMPQGSGWGAPPQAPPHPSAPDRRNMPPRRDDGWGTGGTNSTDRDDRW